LKSSSSKLVAERTEPPRIPDHEVLRCIGRGSYGEVWLARSVTGAMRAVKVVRREDFELDRTFEREFDGIRKFEPISRDHPGLVHVLHVGRNDEEGFYYYVMELGDDRESGSAFDPGSYEPRTMGTDRTARRRLSVSECVEHGITIADALAHLHEHGLNHRDIKPSNIIFVNGRAKLADIGLVATEGQQTFVGTEGFVPPEGPGSSSADIYSLGMVLYEMSTGNDRLQFPEVPSDLVTEGGRPMWLALNDVICKACAPVPKKRYQSARQMADALRLARSVGSGRLRWVRNLMLLPILSAAIAFGFLTWRHGGGLPWPPGRFHDALVPLLPITGSVQIDSDPAGAEVVYDGKPVGRTPVTVEGVSAGGAVFTLRLARHREETVTVEGVLPGRVTPVPTVSLRYYNPPVPGQPWNNSNGMIFDPRGQSHVSRWPVSYDDFRKELQIMSGTVIDEDFGGQGVIYLISVPEAESVRFCEKLTQREVKANLLPDGWYYRPEVYQPRKAKPNTGPALEGPPTICFRCVLERTGRVFVESDPSSAAVYEEGKLLKLTPFTLYDHRAGPVKFTVRLGGYEDTLLEGDVPSGGTLMLKAQLKRSRLPAPGQTWQNQLGMTFQPVGSLLFSRWETRVRDFAPFAAASQRTVAPVDHNNDGKDDQTPDHPVVNVSKADAVAFCQWLTARDREARLLDERWEYRLPTDKEWSEAAGAPNVDDQLKSPAERHLKVTRVYPWLPHYLYPPPVAAADKPAGANLGDLTSLRSAALAALPAEEAKAIELLGYDDKAPHSAPVGSFREGEFLLADMAGNVWEFVSDAYGGANPETAGHTVTRGAAWSTPVSSTESLNTQFRRTVPPDREADPSTGFRIVVAPVPGSIPVPTPESMPADSTVPDEESEDSSALDDTDPPAPRNSPSGP
jgi:formylglycine-generating enzyme required for sulfatase activity